LLEGFLRTRGFTFARGRRHFHWAGPLLCAALLFREVTAIQWTSTSGGAIGGGAVYEVSSGSWAGPSGYTLLLLLLVPLVAMDWLLLVVSLARPRMHPALCPHCGYHRKGLAADTLCPECGRSGGAT
jgi:hypothetical protein